MAIQVEGPGIPGKYAKLGTTCPNQGWLQGRGSKVSELQSQKERQKAMAFYWVALLCWPLNKGVLIGSPSSTYDLLSSLIHWRAHLQNTDANLLKYSQGWELKYMWKMSKCTWGSED